MGNAETATAENSTTAATTAKAATTAPISAAAKAVTTAVAVAATAEAVVPLSGIFVSDEAQREAVQAQTR